MALDILRQTRWLEKDLYKEGFRRYDRKKTVVLARELCVGESPMKIQTAWDTLIAYAGYIICYDATDGVTHESLEEYAQWSVEPHIFQNSYRAWDNSFWTPNGAEQHLINMGCKPYYKFAGVWAKKLDEAQWIQTYESLEPILVPAGGWLTIGIEGEPTSMTEYEFLTRYRPARHPHR